MSLQKRVFKTGAAGAAVALTAMCSACVAIPAGDGLTYHLILGVGVVRTKVPEDSSVIATDTRSLGIVVTDRPGLKLGMGYASSTVVSVPPGVKDTIVEVSTKPWGPIVVDAVCVDDCESEPEQALNEGSSE